MKPLPLNERPIQMIKCILLICCNMHLTSCARVDKYSFENIDYSNYDFQFGNFTKINQTYEEASKEKNRNYALWNNQLGSIYLAEGNYDKALDAFLKAHYLMNDITAFKNLEHSAVRLAGSEDKKAYKGDPYERSMNSLYVGLLFYNKGDLDNAMAAFKNGILADSESRGEEYKSDIAALYLLASRVSKKLGNESMSVEYFDVVKELYNNPNYSILGFNDESVRRMLDLKNNVLLVIEFGEGPFKTREGQYGELAVVYGSQYYINNLNIKVDGKTIDKSNNAYLLTDVYFQASTRGGRKMDGILKGKAIFKKNAADTSRKAIKLSGQFLDQANQASDPNAQAALAAAAGISALFSGGAAIMSGITNPKADIRCWSLLPQYIAIVPLYASTGQHKMDIEFLGGDARDGNESLDYKFNVDIQSGKDSIIFKRILRRVSPEDAVYASGKNTNNIPKLESIKSIKWKNIEQVDAILGKPIDHLDGVNACRDYLVEGKKIRVYFNGRIVESWRFLDK